jgi:hypothetical protein
MDVDFKKSMVVAVCTGSVKLPAGTIVLKKLARTDDGLEVQLEAGEGKGTPVVILVQMPRNLDDRIRVTVARGKEKPVTLADLCQAGERVDGVTPWRGWKPGREEVNGQVSLRRIGDAAAWKGFWKTYARAGDALPDVDFEKMTVIVIVAPAGFANYGWSFDALHRSKQGYRVLTVMDGLARTVEAEGLLWLAVPVARTKEAVTLVVRKGAMEEVAATLAEEK